MQTILLIDDSRPQLLNAQFTLQRGGYRVETLSDSARALERIEELQPDLVITDINMPVKDGITIVTEVRQSGRCAAMPLLVMSTDAQKHLLEQARLAGANGWLLKPVKQEELLAAVAKLLPPR